MSGVSGMNVAISGRGFFARPVVVDEQDLHLFTEFNWCDNGAGYLVTVPKGTRRKLYLHRLILDAAVGVVVDHINGDTYDNRRCNLRTGTHADNLNNARKKGHRKCGRAIRSKYIGVAWGARSWVAAFRGTYCGLFTSEDDAARAIDAERVHQGYEPRNPQLGVVTREVAALARSQIKPGPNSGRSLS